MHPHTRLPPDASFLPDQPGADGVGSPELDWLVRALRGEAYWPPAGIDGDRWESILAAAEVNQVRELLYWIVRETPVWNRLPGGLRRELQTSYRRAAARELFLEEEIAKDLDALAARGIDALLLKGTALAYSLYAAPGQRPRCDVDLLLRDKTTANDAWPLLEKRGFTRSPAISGELVSHQFTCARKVNSNAGVVLDIHWKLSNSNFFARKFTFEELRAERVAVKTLGPNAFALSLPHALVHALFHRIGHLGEEQRERLLWLYDIDLICRHLDRSQWNRFAELVAQSDLGPICRDGIEQSRALFGTPIPDGLSEQLEPADPRSCGQLVLKQPGYRRILFEIQSLPSWPMRLGYLREHLLPDRFYMKQRFGAANLPALMAAYVRRAWGGATKIVRRRH